jgi:cholesterol oxidase
VLHEFEAIVVGTGFGGAVTACRMSRKWPGRVLILERGGRYPKGSFLRSPRDAIRSFWDVTPEDSSRSNFLEESDAP